MTAREGGLTWRVAKIHPSLIFAALFVALIYVVYLDEIVIEPEPRFRGLVPALWTAIFLSYPLFVILFVSGRFASRSPRRVKLPTAAFFAAQALFVFSAVVMGTSTTDVDREFNTSELFALGTCSLATGFGLLYLLIGAPVALVRAERGHYGSLLQVFGAFLLFLYGPFFGWYFLHRRVRRLVTNYETCAPIAI